MTYPSDLWEYCTFDCLGMYELPNNSQFMTQIHNKLYTKFHEKHIQCGQVPMLSWFGGVCEYCDNYQPSDKDYIELACQIPTFAAYFNQLKSDFITVNAFMNRLTRSGSGLEDYRYVLSLRMTSHQVIGYVLDKIRRSI